jgi:hypothetical protein
MKNIILISAAIVTIIGGGISVYMMGKSSSNEPTSNAVEITITNAISSLPQNEQESAKDLMEPVLDLIKAISNEKTPAEDLKQYENRFKDKLKDFSLASYQASKSPFIPPTTKVQLFCNNVFTFFYKGKTGSKNSILYSVDGNSYSLNIGGNRLFRSDGSKLKFTYLEYDKQRNGPILQYECLDEG